MRKDLLYKWSKECSHYHWCNLKIAEMGSYCVVHCCCCLVIAFCFGFGCMWPPQQYILHVRNCPFAAAVVVDDDEDDGDDVNDDDINFLFSFGQLMNAQMRWRLMALTSKVSC